MEGQQFFPMKIRVSSHGSLMEYKKFLSQKTIKFRIEDQNVFFLWKPIFFLTKDKGQRISDDLLPVDQNFPSQKSGRISQRRSENLLQEEAFAQKSWSGKFSRKRTECLLLWKNKSLLIEEQNSCYRSTNVFIQKTKRSSY